MSEHDEQVALFQWADIYKNEIPELEMLFAIPNQGGGGMQAVRRGKKMVKEGLKAGVPDIFLPVAKADFHGLFVEMKYGDGRVSKDQKRWLNNLTHGGYLCVVAYNFDAAKDAILDYLQGNLNEEMELRGPRMGLN